MKFDLKKPCKNCPFRTDIPAYLKRERVEKLRSDLEPDKFSTFSCHKTVDYSDGEGKNTEDTQHCAGALILMEKVGSVSNSIRVAERLGMYDRRILDMDAPVYDSWEEMEDDCD